MERYTLSAQVYEAILSLIASGKLRPGEQVPDGALAEDLGVSRTPVRDAQAALAAHGLLERRAHYGCFVAKPTPDELRSLFQVREATEGMAARLMALQGDSQAVAALEGLAPKLLTAVQERNRHNYRRYDFQFHRQILRACNNKYLSTVGNAESLILLSFLVSEFYQESANGLPWPLTEDDSHHKQVLQAIQARDPDAAEEAMREHLRTTSEAIQLFLSASRLSQVAVPQQG